MTLTTEELAALLLALRPLTPAPDADALPHDRYFAFHNRLTAQSELLDKVADEVAALHRLVEGLGDRILAQAELLAKRAEGPNRRPLDAVANAVRKICDPATPEGVAFAVVSREMERIAITDDPEADLVAPPAPPAPPPVNIGGRLHERRLQVCRLLAVGPLHTASICERADIPKGSLYEVMSHCSYFAKRGERMSPWVLTDAGREALAAAGYVGVGETKPVPAETNSPEPEAPRSELAAAERAEAQCGLIARAIAASPSKWLAEPEIVRETGLPERIVEQRLSKQGPQAPHGAKKYFLRETGGLYRLTNAGFDLAQKEAAQ